MNSLYLELQWILYLHPLQHNGWYVKAYLCVNICCWSCVQTIHPHLLLLVTYCGAHTADTYTLLHGYCCGSQHTLVASVTV